MNHRGAYVAKLDLAQPHLAGVAEKVRAQVAALSTVPATVDLYHLAGGAVMCNGEPIRSAGSGPLAKRVAHYLLFNLVLASRRDPLDFIYIRYQLSSPMLLWALGRLRKRNPGLIVMIEFPSWPYHSEAVSTREKLLAWLDRRSRTRLRRHVDRAITFSRESRILGIPTIATDNGVDVAQAPVLPARIPDGVFRLLGLANLSFWHGYDRVIEGIARYYENGGNRDIRFDVVGTGSELARLQELVAKYDLAERVHFHGMHRGPGLESLLATADLGVSSIGMHRLEVNTSNLKSREFCARGLPFVIAYPDHDFPPRLPFAFHAPADDSPIDILSTLAFRENLLVEHPDYRSDMRTYAEQRLTWRVKMQPVVTALRELLQGQKDGRR